jgi:ribosome maturation factor RimP
MNLFEKNIKDTAVQVIERNGFFLIDLILRGNENNRVIEIFIDGELNISAEDCAKVSREVSAEIEAKDLIETNYRLIVSSPGTDRPLLYLKQYPKHINRMFDIIYDQNNETKKLSGKLLYVSGDELTFLSNNNKEILINFNNIKKARVIAGFFPKG